MMEDLNFRRNVDPAKRRQNNRQLAELKELQTEFKRSKSDMEKSDKKLGNENDRLSKATAAVEDARNRLSLAQEEIDADYLPEGAQPRARIQLRDKYLMEVQQLEMALDAQKLQTSKASEDFFEKERIFFQADKALLEFAGDLDDIMLAKKTIEELDKEKAKRVAAIEKRSAANRAKEARLAKEAKEAQESEMERLRAEQAATAQKLNKMSKSKMAASHTFTHETTQKIKAAHEARHEDRVEAVMELKDNINAVNADLAGRAEKFRAKNAAAAKRLEDEKEALLSKGLNPYVTFRKQEFADEAARREKRMLDAVERNKADLAARMAKEEAFLKKQETAKLEALNYEKQHRAAQGRHVIEERNRSYIEQKTAAHTEVLDPSGKAARIDPSQITDIPDYTFGLGKSARIPQSGVRRITEQIRQELNVERDNYGEYGRLVSGLVKRSQSLGVEDGATLLGGQAEPEDGQFQTQEGVGETAGAGTADTEEPDSSTVGTRIVAAAMSAREIAQLETLATQSGAMPGADKTAIAVNLNNDEIKQSQLLTLAIQEDGKIGGGSELVGTKSPKYKISQLTKFERDSLERAKHRHRERIEDGVEQIAGGKLFKGDAFVSKPAMLIFQDFEVGRSYRKVFTLTNVSYTFNSFKLLDLDDAVVDFFVITFTKPGRMSAGMSCNLEIVFSPQINQDIFTHICFQSETGPVRIPLQCLIKRCAPRVTTPTIDFGDVVIGQKVTLPLKINNTQALSTKFTIYPLFKEASRGVTINDVAHEIEPAADGDHALLAETADVDGELTSNEAAAATTTAAAAGVERTETDNTSGKLALQTGENGPDARASAGGGGGDDLDMLDQLDGDGEEEEGAGEHQGSEPAINLAELQTRVRRVMTQVVRDKKKENPNPLSCLSYEGVVDGYGETSVQVLCAPLTLGAIEQRFVVVFESVNEAMGSVDDLGELVTKEQIVKVSTFGEEVPIYVAEETMDLKCTLHDRIFRKKVVVKNRAKSAYRVMIKVPPMFSSFVEVNPTLFFVQTKGSQSINVKFTPSTELLTKAAHFTLPYEDFLDAALTQLPIEIQAVNQEIPAYFIVSSSICPSTLDFSSPVLSFGKVYVGQKSTRKISIRNKSMLPQKMAFVRLRKEFILQPNDGFAVLLPNEEMEFEVSFGPQSAINYEVDLTVLTSFNDSYTVKVMAEGIDPPIALSNAVIRMRTTPPGERVVESTIVKNQTRHVQCFQVMQPPPAFSWITVSPTVMELQPGQGCRLEIEFLPPANARDLDPVDWHEDTVKQLTAGDNNAVGEGKEADAAIAVEAADGGLDGPVESPFQEWDVEAGWVFAQGLYGGIQWVKPGAGKEKHDAIVKGDATGDSSATADGDIVGEGTAAAVDSSAHEPIGSAAATASSSSKRAPSKTTGSAAEEKGDTDAAASVSSNQVEDQQHDQMGGEDDADMDSLGDGSAAAAGVEPFQDIPDEEWGINGRWNFPIVLRPRKRSSNSSQSTLLASTATDAARSPLKLNTAASAVTLSADAALGKSGGTLKKEKVQPSPLFLSIETAVNLPQIDADTKNLDFGQISVGTRQLKSFKIFNRGQETVQLKSVGLNALGPFTLIRPVKEIPANEARVIIVECLPVLPGLIVEVLEISSALAEVGGHRINITFRVQGLKPAVVLEKLDPPPSNWNPLSGILDFGNVLMQDYVRKSFILRNQSTFPINATVVRIAGDGLSPVQQAGAIERTAAGLPVFTISPENVTVNQGETQEIEVVFRPDRGRFQPFREDVDIIIGKTDEVLRVGLLGRSWNRQLIVLTDDPRDEPFSKPANKGATAVAGVEDVLLSSGSTIIRKTAETVRETLKLTTPELPAITLEFPDPFAKNAPKGSYTEVGGMDAAGASSKASTKGRKPDVSGAAVGSRQQVKKLVLCSTKNEDGRPGLAAGTFEVILSADAVASGLFALSIDKGPIALSGEVQLEFTCTVPKPRSLGGIVVGSWREFQAQIILRGGWHLPGKPDEHTVPVSLRAYVCL